MLQVGAFQVFMLKRTPEVAYQCMRHMEPFLPFKDASSAPPCFHLTVLSTIQVRTFLSFTWHLLGNRNLIAAVASEMR